MKEAMNAEHENASSSWSYSDYKGHNYALMWTEFSELPLTEMNGTKRE